jgi:UDP-glucose 4-epimerase
VKNLLLVGATGFLGQHLKKFYQTQGWHVYTLGRSSCCDYIFEPNNLDSLFDIDFTLNFDRIIHAAAINEVDINKNITDTYSVNVTLTRYLIELSHQFNIPEFVYISTFHVYGKSDGIIDCNSACEPKNDYALTHYLSEQVVGTLGRVYGISTLIVRPTNIYGCPVDMDSFNRWTLVPFAFIKSAKEERVITIESTGKQIRNFVSVNDVVKSTLLVDRLNVVNAYGLDTLSIKEFAQSISRILMSEYELKIVVNWLEDKDRKKVNQLTFTENTNYLPNEKVDNYIQNFYRVIK